MARPKGFADWKPNDETLDLIANIQSVLREYSAQLPMTARQIFYRLVGAYGYPKTERDYKNLCEKLVRARRARLISFADIRDDGTATLGGDHGFDDPDDFYAYLRRSWRGYGRMTREGQTNRIELWCEAAGMAPQLQRVASDFGVPVYSTGGFSSVTVTHEIAQRALSAQDEDLATIFLHVGDYDPSGESIFEAMTTDALSFYVSQRGGGRLVDFEDEFRSVRVALTEDQVAEHELPTAPAKDSDSRSVNWAGETAQAEAMPPDLLASTVRTALEEWTDMTTMEAIEEKADAERDAIRDRLAEIDF
jgi:hypothetical protein